MSRRICRITALALAGFLTVVPVVAHEGHDHGDEEKTALAVAPRAAEQTELFDVVAVVERGVLRIFVDRADTNEPVSAAKVEVEAGGKVVAGAPQPDGTFRVDLRPIGVELVAGSHALTVTVDDGREVDIVALTLVIDEAAKPAKGTAKAGKPGAAASGAVAKGTAAAAPIGSMRTWFASAFAWMGWAIAVALVLWTAVVLPRRARRGSGGAASVVAAWIGLAVFAAAASLPAPARAQAEPAQRLSDGSLFVPKAAQRLLGVRTIRAEQGEVAQTWTLQGRVLPDPNHLGHVQASQSGRIEPGPGGIPLVGQAVRKGQVLASVRPAVSAVDKAGQRNQVAELRLALDLAERKARRFEALEGSVPQREIDQARAELDALRDRLPTLQRAIDASEALVAPVSGVVTVSSASPGQLVNPSDVVFEIVAPGRVLIEATSYDNVLALPNAKVTLVNYDVVLRPAGSAPLLRDGARVLHFVPQMPAPALLINQLVQVVVALPSKERAIVLPRDALVQGAASTGTVLVKRAPERFEPVAVSVRHLGGQRVAVASGGGGGLSAGDRVVVSGAASLAQVR